MCCCCCCRSRWSPSPSPFFVATATWLWHHWEAHQASRQLLPGRNTQDRRLSVWGGHQARKMSSPGQQVTGKAESGSGLELLFMSRLSSGDWTLLFSVDQMDCEHIRELANTTCVLMVFSGRWWTPWFSISRWPSLVTFCQFMMGRGASTLLTHFLSPLVG